MAVGGLVCLSRVSLLISCAAGVPAARPDGLGAVGGRGGAASGRRRSGSWSPAAVACGLLAADRVAVVARRGRGAARPGWWSLLVLRCTRRFGGITGDVLGAGIELALAALLIVASAGLSCLAERAD